MSRTIARGAGELLVTAGLVLLLFVAWSLWFTGLSTSAQQDRLRAALDERWEEPPPAAAPVAAPDPAPAPPVPSGPTEAPAPEPVPRVHPVPTGEALAVLRVPRFGADYAPVVVEGTGREELRRGPGHLPGTALPGEVGNFVVSAHRTTYGAELRRADELVPGDPLVVETGVSWLVYRVTGSRVVAPTAVEVTLPVPDQPGAAPSRAVLTLTTCHPVFSARERLVVSAELVGSTAKDAGPPAVLAA